MVHPAVLLSINFAHLDLFKADILILDCLIFTNYIERSISMKQILYILLTLGIGAIFASNLGLDYFGSKKCSCGPNSNCCGPVSRQQRPIDARAQENKQQNDVVKNTVKEAYTQVAQEGGCCSLFGGGCCGGGADLSEYIGYSKEELEELGDANLGLGCGNPVNLGEFKDGFTVLDLGSGAGLDCFLAAKKVGPTGMIIGVDMTPEMIEKARENAQKYKIENVEFRLGDIENLPVASNSIDIIMSNCVINLAPDKDKVFEEAARVLKNGGKMYVSDVVLLGELSDEQKNDTNLLCACVSGALLKDTYLAKLKTVGFEIEIVGEDLEIGKKWFQNDELPISSLKFVAIKK